MWELLWMLSMVQAITVGRRANMKRIAMVALALVAVAMLVVGGCSWSDSKQTLCGKCGQVKGTAVCCAPGALKCGKCGLAKGSPGCCKLPKLEAPGSASKGSDTK
jgi:hypothetical protein